MVVGRESGVVVVVDTGCRLVVGGDQLRVHMFRPRAR